SLDSVNSTIATLLYLLLVYYPFSHSPDIFFLLIPPPPRSTLFPYTTLFRSQRLTDQRHVGLDAFMLLGEKLAGPAKARLDLVERSEEHTSELQSRGHLVCRLLLEKKIHS